MFCRSERDQKNTFPALKPLMEWISKSEEAKFKRMFPKVDVEQGTILKMNIRENITLPIVNELSHARKFLNKQGGAESYPGIWKSFGYKS